MKRVEENSKLLAEQEELILSCKNGLFKIDGTLNAIKLCSASENINGMAVDSRNQRLYYMDAGTGTDRNVLKYARLSSTSEISHMTSNNQNIKDIPYEIFLKAVEENCNPRMSFFNDRLYQSLSFSNYL